MDLTNDPTPKVSKIMNRGGFMLKVMFDNDPRWCYFKSRREVDVYRNMYPGAQIIRLLRINRPRLTMEAK